MTALRVSARVGLSPAIPLALAAVVALAGCGRSAADSAGASGKATAAVPVRLGRIERRPFAPSVSAPGQWTARTRLSVVAPFAAVVASFRPEAGDRVARGDTLGWLVTRESYAAMRGAEILLRQAGDDAARAEARRALDLAARDRVRVPLLAAAAGTVVRRNASDGAEVAAGDELASILPDGALVFDAHVTLEDAGRVRPGQPARIDLDGSGTVEAIVDRRLPEASPGDLSAVFRLRPTGPAPRDVLDRQGVAHVRTGSPHDAPAAPDSALAEDDLTGTISIAVVGQDSVAAWTRVRTGTSAAGWTELLAPAPPAGTLVVVAGQRGLPDSTRVTARP